MVVSIQGSFEYCVFLLDPWSYALVSTRPVWIWYQLATTPLTVVIGRRLAATGSEMLYDIANNSDRYDCLVMAYGGHHTDFMFASDLDPPDIPRSQADRKADPHSTVDLEWRNQQRQPPPKFPYNAQQL
jgi:hypothetical protein